MKWPYDHPSDTFTCPSCGETSTRAPSVTFVSDGPVDWQSWRELVAAFVDLVRTRIASKIAGRAIELLPETEDTVSLCKWRLEYQRLVRRRNVRR